jgi:Dyp-type peroxidase family
LRPSDAPRLEIEDIQSGVLRPRPTPYAAAYVVLRIDDPRAGRMLMKRLSDLVAPASDSANPTRDTWVSAALSYRGLEVLGVPAPSLATFPMPFQQGMAARAHALGDDGESSPEHWEPPLGSRDVHVVLTAVSPDTARLEVAFERARQEYRELSGLTALWRQDCHVLPGEREAFGFKDGVSHPAIAGSGIAGSNPSEVPLAPGELVLGYPDETGAVGAIPEPAILGRNGSYVVFRKLHQRVAEFRRYLKDAARSPEDEEILAAKMMGRWRSGAPLARCPMHDDPALGVDGARRNDFGYADDPIGYKTPLGAHIRRMNPRDAQVAGVPRIHRMIRRGTSYGPLLAEGVLEDDGVDRGLMFAFIGAHIARQFEFVQSEWLNKSDFFGGAPARDPVAGAGDGEGVFDIPTRPLKRRLEGLPRFVVTRGGEYCFIPSLRALRWLSELHG